MLVKELRNGLTAPDGTHVDLPDEFLEVIPEKCNCGSDLDINETLTILSCPNPHCVHKVTQRLTDMLASLGVLGFGESRCYDFIIGARATTPYAVFAFNPDTDMARFANTKLSEDMLRNLHNQLADKRTMTLAAYVKCGFFPGIQDSAFRLFKGYATMEEFYEDLDEEGIYLIADLLGVPVEGKTAIQTFDVLRTYRKELLLCTRFVNLTSGTTKEYNICISTAVGPPYKNKADFVNQMQSQYGSKANINWLGSVTQSGCDYLICADKNGTTSKCVKARKYGVPIITGAEFEAMLKQL